MIIRSQLCYLRIRCVSAVMLLLPMIVCPNNTLIMPVLCDISLYNQGAYFSAIPNIQNIMSSAVDRSLNLDQDIVLDSDRKMTSISSEPEHRHQSAISPPSQATFRPSADTFTLAKALHPVACIATVFFKIGALVLYMFIGMVVPNVITFIFVIVMAALDFWVVKNVTGRLLVGLRWWSEYDSKGEQVWRFQSYNKHYEANPVDNAFFWTGQIVATAIWAFFLLIKILSFSLFWGILTAINCGLCGLNLYGYYRCRADYKGKLKGLQNLGLKHLAGRLFS